MIAMAYLTNITFKINIKMNHEAIILAAIELAQTEKGAAIIKNNYAGSENFGDIYKTQQAAALSALMEALEYNDPEYLAGKTEFSVHAAKRADGSIYYAADIGLNDNMTHTDDWGFCGFLDDTYDFDEDWIEEIFSGDFELGDFNMSFNIYKPYALNEVYQIASNSDQAITPSRFYYQNSQPVVIELENNQYLAATIGNEESRHYGILDQEDFDNLLEALNDVNPHDIDYACTIYKAIDSASVYCSSTDRE